MPATATPPARPASQRRAPNVIRDEKGGFFRIVAGSHIGQGPPDCQCDACFKSDGKNHSYDAWTPQMGVPRDEYDGDIITSPDQDLCLRFNAGPASVKFERVQEDGSPLHATFGRRKGVPTPEEKELEQLRRDNAELKAKLEGSLGMNKPQGPAGNPPQGQQGQGGKK